VTISDPIRMLVLDEFRLRVADTDGAAARIVASAPAVLEPAIPLLTSIDDRRDVAMLRAVHAGEAIEADAAQRAELDPLVSSWAVPKHYGPRIAESSQSPPASSFRLAVTESGINTVADPVTSEEAAHGGATRSAIGLVWIGAPIGTHAGLLVLVGSYVDPRSIVRDPSGWPRPLNRQLGVRIYDNHPA
jgi:hypothetical protein